ncbi:MAG: acyl-CoA dehydrogenase family protein, partial [Polyangiales bacterium]
PTSERFAAAKPLEPVNELIEKAKRIGAEVAAKHAADVDAKARFPQETIDALRKEKLLSAFVPKEFGGRGATLTEIAGICFALGQHCATSAMVYAMHQIQVAVIVRHGQSSESSDPPEAGRGAREFFRKYMVEMSEKELLIASATTELGPSGNTRMSSCAVELLPGDGGEFKLEKNAPVISYGEHADAILITSRKSPEAATSDQVITLIRKGEYTLEKTGTWDTIGMRGTCSNGFMLRAQAHVDQIVPIPFADVSSQTMLPFSHVVWTSLWSGIGADAMNKARQYIRGEARKKPGVVPPGALRLAEAMNVYQSMRANIMDCTRDYERRMNDPEALANLGFVIKMNNLKVATTQVIVQVVGLALGIVGIAGYKNDNKWSLGRHLRDCHGGALMISNERIYGANASLLCVYKDD